MKIYYTYTLRRNLKSIHQTSMYRNILPYSSDEYYDPATAGQALEVRPYYINFVLKFVDDRQFRKFHENVQSTRRFTGGGNQFSHPNRPKPVAVRGIRSRTWHKLN